MHKIKFKNKKIFWYIGIFTCLVGTAFGISFNNIHKNSEISLKNYSPIIIEDTPKKAIISDAAQSVVENASVNNDFSSNFDNLNSSQTSFTQRNEIKINTGFESMTNEKMRSCYENIKAVSREISPQKNANGMFDAKPIHLRGVKLTAEEINKAILAVYNDNPDIFWMNDNYTIVTSKAGTTLKLSSFLSPYEISDYVKNFDKKIKKIIENAPKNASDYDLELYIHDYIIDNCTYDKTESGRFSNLKYSSYGCIIDGKAVCSGMSRANQILLNKLGVECRVITGESRKEPHMWNVVKIGDKWYHEDITWDNTSNTLNRYYYLNVNDKIIDDEHNKNPEYPPEGITIEKNKRYNFNIPICDSLDENFFTKNSVKITHLNSYNYDLIKAFSKKASNLEKYLYLQIASSINFDHAVKKLLLNEPYIVTKSAETYNRNFYSTNKINLNKIFYSKFPLLRAITLELNY